MDKNEVRKIVEDLVKKGLSDADIRLELQRLQQDKIAAERVNRLVDELATIDKPKYPTTGYMVPVDEDAKAVSNNNQVYIKDNWTESVSPIKKFYDEA